MDHVFKNFLDRLLAVYGEPKSDAPELFAKEYARVLEGFEPKELAMAADRILESFKFGHWPKINDCVAACEAARRDIAMQSAGGIPVSGTKGTGWRMSDSGKKWFQIDRGSPEFAAWMQYFRANGRGPFADFVTNYGRTWTTGASPMESGPAMLAILDNIFMKLAQKREERAT